MRKSLTRQAATKNWLHSLSALTFLAAGAAVCDASPICNSSKADEGLSEYDKYAASVISDFETLVGCEWNECRYFATRVLQNIGSLKPESKDFKKSLKKYQQEFVLPILLEKLDFRRTRRRVSRYSMRRSPSDNPPPYPVTGTLIDIGKPVIQPLLGAVAKRPRSATYVYQARIVLRRLAGSEVAVEKLVRDYARAHPKAAARIERLSIKCDLGPQLRKEFEYQRLLKQMEPRSMMIPPRNKKFLRTLQAIEKVTQPVAD